jgi:integrase
MIRRNIIPEYDASGNIFTVGHFRHAPHELVIDYIKRVQEWSESTRQVHAAVYISFTAYLARISQGWIRKAEPSTLAANPTFYQIREKCATNALTLADWHKFITALTDINERDALIARSTFHGAKRISEAISITLSQIDWEKNIIKYKQSKTGGTFREIPITFPQYFMEELKAYIESTAAIRKDSPYVFITRTGKMVTRLRLNHSFDQAGKKAKIKFKVTPHVLRATWVTLVREQGASDSQIMQVTGHRNNKMVLAYDKTSDEQNISKKINFI